MTKLRVTLIDVGWGDSILLEAQGPGPHMHYGLIDSNDTQTLRSSYVFLKRLFEREGIDIENARPIFDFVLLSHAHADHAQGLKAAMRAFGTKDFWYPKSLTWASCADLIRYANRSSRVARHQALDETNVLPQFGTVTMKVLSPERDDIDDRNENNNSVVLALEVGDVSFVLTGDAEKEVWEKIASEIPANTLFFKVPHHGSENGTLDDASNPVWLDDCPQEAVLGISSHVRPFDHPDEEVVNLFDARQRTYYRTDRHYHVSFETDGHTVSVKYSHEE